jgi:outer membrane protein assembly factor BamA
VGGDYSRLSLDIPAGSVLDQQRHSGSAEVREILDGPDRHGLAAAQVSLEYDSRDNEIVTRTGSFHQLLVRTSPRLGPTHPFSFTEANATLRSYGTPLRWLQIAGRLVGDVLIGHPPIYELTRIADTSVVGGSKGIRGVPGQRYYGKVKVFGNLEARAEVWHFDALHKPFALAAAGFVDAGRVWAELTPHPELDGRGLGLKYGVGGGLRLQEGQTFVVRFDLAWSPDARPIGAYFSAGETF